eukprot:CAMPEP_0184487548 /NCGR_PEP_ID=MMETSP0113_2-20130426/10184_1 /TAXON_ID=91329 /ORGANISM="Norrisiella sphaerica, Strain BC52" /LENGTH=447 /DNA_ID=CAMNT_0026869903 /DNA_START=338 /DNA_END=1681 /DNA_ORIENTATION=+
MSSCANNSTICADFVKSENSSQHIGLTGLTNIFPGFSRYLEEPALPGFIFDDSHFLCFNYDTGLLTKKERSPGSIPMRRPREVVENFASNNVEISEDPLSNDSLNSEMNPPTSLSPPPAAVKSVDISKIVVKPKSAAATLPASPLIIGVSARTDLKLPISTSKQKEENKLQKLDLNDCTPRLVKKRPRKTSIDSEDTVKPDSQAKPAKGKESKKKKKAAAKKRKFKRPKTAYNFFQLEVHASIWQKIKKKAKTSVDRMQHNESVARIIGTRWKALTKKQRKKYQKMADDDKARCDKENAAAEANERKTMNALSPPPMSEPEISCSSSGVADCSSGESSAAEDSKEDKQGGRSRKRQRVRKVTHIDIGSEEDDLPSTGSHESDNGSLDTYSDSLGDSGTVGEAASPVDALANLYKPLGVDSVGFLGFGHPDFSKSNGDFSESIRTFIC